MIPKSSIYPKNGRNNLGTTIAVKPLYATRRGKVATVGTINLYLHFKSITSSTKPNRTTKHIESKAALYSTNYNLISKSPLTYSC